MLGIGVSCSPDVDKFTGFGGFFWRMVEDIFEGCRFCFGVSWRFVPVFLGIG